jgi:hypothetical protein
MIMTYPSACSRAGTGVSHRFVTDLFRFLGLTHLKVSTIALECRDDVQFLDRSAVCSPAARSWSDRSAVDHQSRSVQSTESDQGSRHVLVTARDNNHSVEPVATRCCLNRVGNEVSGLERVGH